MSTFFPVLGILTHFTDEGLEIQRSKGSCELTQLGLEIISV